MILATAIAILPTDAAGLALLVSSPGRMVRLKEIVTMSLQHLEFEALKILTALVDMNSARVTAARAAADALAEALADAIEAADRAAKIAA